MTGKQKWATIDTNIQKMPIKKKYMLGSNWFSRDENDWQTKMANIGKLYKIINQKSIHTGPTNSAGKSFPNRSEFALVAVDKGLVAHYVKS